MTEPLAQPRPDARRLARASLAALLLTFLVSRIVVLLIMTRRIPDLYFYAGQTHVHHLNYGIFLLVTVGSWMLLAPPGTLWRRRAALLWGVGLGLTFDEFGLWLHLGGGYWQRASYDAIVILAASLALIAYAPDWRHLRPKHWAVLVAALVLLAAAAYFSAESLGVLGQRLDRIEQNAPQ
jgi:hypothetical protein